MVAQAHSHGVDITNAKVATAAAPAAALMMDDMRDAPGVVEGTPTGAPAEALGPVDPHALKEEADGLFKAGNPARAVGLYAKALELDATRDWEILDHPGSPAGAPENDTPASGESRGIRFRILCLSNRAACNLALEDYPKVVDDCTAAITASNAFEKVRCTPRCAVAVHVSSHTGHCTQDAELRSRLLQKLHMRRSVAYTQLARVEEAAADNAAAQRLAEESGMTPP